MRFRVIIGALSLLLFALNAVSQTAAQPERLPAGETARDAVGSPTDRIPVLVTLSDPPLVHALINARPANAPRKSVPWSAAQQRVYAQNLLQKQTAVTSVIRSLGGTVTAQLTRSANGVAALVERRHLGVIRAATGVTAVLPAPNSQRELGDVVPYVGAAALHQLNPSVDGTGISIGILDSGIDYTHRNLGGPGTVAAYQASYGVPVSGACGPTAQNSGAPAFNAKVVGGFDFVGEVWPNGPLAPDPNPIDCEGHGTSVADIAGGRSLDGAHRGIAPGSKLHAIKVCSAVSTSCSGLAILQGLEYAIDPNFDFDVSDALDVINLSLGGAYGQREEASTYVVQLLSQFGIVVAAAAGNDSDRPYVVSGPGSAPGAITVAETQVPSAFVLPLIITSPSTVAGTYLNTAFQPWSPKPMSDISAPLRLDPNLGSGGCAPYSSGFFAGSIALIRRGTCNASTKVENAALAGALAVVIDNNVAGDAPSFGFGGGSTFVPAIGITLALGTNLRTAGLPINAVISVSSQLNLSRSMVSLSSRGPNNGYTAIKPDIGAPGASLSAASGTGNQTRAFGGTSGATPVIAGSSALLLQAYPDRQVHEIKALLMNAAETQVFTNPATLPGELAPITRIGAGEVRTNAAYGLKAAMWDSSNSLAGSLSFGYQAVQSTAPRRIAKRVTVRNWDSAAKTYSIAISYRYANDASSGAVTFSAPTSVTVPGNSSSSFLVNMTIDAAKLPVWRSTGINSGSQGANGPLLQTVEFDGYVTLTAGGERLSLPWHVLPRRSHNALAAASATAASGAFGLSNVGGATDAPAEVFYLTGTSPQQPVFAFPGPGDNFQTVDLRAAGVRAVNIGTNAAWSGNLGVQFAVSSFDTRTHANTYPQINIAIDSNRDGVTDFFVRNATTTTFGNAVFVQAAGSTASTGYFFTIVDLNSSNMILTVPASVIGVTADAPFNFTVRGVDWGFTGDITDVLPVATVQLNLPKYAPPGFSLNIPAGFSGNAPFTAPAGGAAASPSQRGFLTMFVDGRPGAEAAVTVID
jgi:hypothetical protein